MTLSRVCANVVEQLKPVCDYLDERGYKTLLIDGTVGENRLPLKAAAVKAGLGWIGKNTLLVNEKYGSFQSFGAILTDADIHEVYPLTTERCGSCTNCIDACPTQAIHIPKQLNRPRCIADMMLHDEGATQLKDIDTQGYFRECDICQNACTWNHRHLKKPLDTKYGSFFDSEKLTPLLQMEQLKSMSEETYSHELEPWMGNASVPYSMFRRNVSATMPTARD